MCLNYLLLTATLSKAPWSRSRTKKKCVKGGRGGLAGIQLALGGQSLAVAISKRHFHRTRCIRDRQHKGNPDLAKDTGEIKKARGKAAGLGLGSPKGMAPCPQHATGAALLALRGLGFLFQGNPSSLCTPLPARLAHPQSRWLWTT